MSGNKKLWCLAVISMALQFGAGNVHSAILYGHDGGGDDCGLYRLLMIDTTLETVTPVGADDQRCGPEIQLSPDGNTVFMSDKYGDDEKSLKSINPVTGLNTGSVVISNYPDGTNIVTALEFFQGVLYGSAHQAGPESNPGILVTVNVATGELTEIGEMTGMNRPTGGMHYVNGAMYAVTATDNNDSSLFTINLATGQATLVAPLTLLGQPFQAATGLAYADGKMYVISSDDDTNLYSANLSTGVLTLEFDLGSQMVALTSSGSNVSGTAVPTAPVPTLSWLGACLLIILLAGLAGFRHRSW